MASPVQVCLALLLVSCVHGQAPSYLNELSRQCTSVIMSEMRNCSLALHGTLGTTSFSDTAVIFNAICNNIPAVGNVFSCLRSSLATCLSSETLGLLQTDAMARDSYQYYCDHRSEINISCIANVLSPQSCVINALNAYSVAVSQTGLVRATCNYLEAVRVCYFNLGIYCSNHNRDVYDTYSRTSYPPACAGGARIVPTPILLLGACAMLLNKVATVFLF